MDKVYRQLLIDSSKETVAKLAGSEPISIYQFSTSTFYSMWPADGVTVCVEEIRDKKERLQMIINKAALDKSTSSAVGSFYDFPYTGIDEEIFVPKLELFVDALRELTDGNNDYMEVDWCSLADLARVCGTNGRDLACRIVSNIPAENITALSWM